ncbi:hypothetical protein Syun_016568 [Stephania yunnanensis]|uniref:Uncharacterized protein n=1 Tax=Stephania yunnanensis TaxID=152371 RepID=A0AAP0J7R2_9MAGN
MPLIGTVASFAMYKTIFSSTASMVLKNLLFLQTCRVAPESTHQAMSFSTTLISKIIAMRSSLSFPAPFAALEEP